MGSNKSTELLTFWFICYRKRKKSMWSDRETRTDSTKTFYVQVSKWNRTTNSWLSGDRHLQFPDCIIEMGFLVPLKKSIIHNVDIKFSVLWAPESTPLEIILSNSQCLPFLLRQRRSVVLMWWRPQEVSKSLEDEFWPASLYRGI